MIKRLLMGDRSLHQTVAPECRATNGLLGGVLEQDSFFHPKKSDDTTKYFSKHVKESDTLNISAKRPRPISSSGKMVKCDVPKQREFCWKSSIVCLHNVQRLGRKVYYDRDFWLERHRLGMRIPLKLPSKRGVLKRVGSQVS